MISQGIAELKRLPEEATANRSADRPRQGQPLRRKRKLLITLSITTATLLCTLRMLAADTGWMPLFNGKDLAGWTPKIRGYDLGENFANTFRVENGAICVNYDGYTSSFDDRFGHLYYKEPFSNYVLRVEYRFVGQQVPGGPSWALRNSGVMIHGQNPKTIGKNQNFPVSIEVQLLGGDGRNPRTTGNLCTPGTHVIMNGQLFTPHCLNSKSRTLHGDQWVTVEIQVHSNKKIIHRINGENVLEYEYPQLDPGDSDAKPLIKDGNTMLFGGSISLQSESHPVQFRRIEIKQLNE